MVILLRWNIGMDAVPLFDWGEWRPYRCLPDVEPFTEDDILRLLLLLFEFEFEFDDDDVDDADGELLLWLLLKYEALLGDFCK